MSTQKKAAIFIDGSNLYFKLRDLEISKTTFYDYNSFAKWLARGRKISSQTYYIGAVKAKPDNKKGQLMRQEQQRLFSHLESQNFSIKRGYLMKNDGTYHEKGVDVQMATDLLIGAYENLWDVAIIISSDTDLIPAIEKVKSLNKEIEYIGFAHKPSFGLQRYANISRLLIKDEIIKFEYQK